MYINIYYLCLHYTYISLYIFTAKIITIVESNIREKYSFEICRLIMTDMGCYEVAHVKQTFMFY